MSETTDSKDTKARPAGFAKWLVGRVSLIPALLACVAMGYFLHWALVPVPSGAPSQRASTQPSEPEKLYVCPMNFAPHAYFSSTDPNEKCGLCGMELKLAEKKGPRTVLSDAAMKLLDVQTTPVTQMYPQAEIRMVGKIDFDETKLAYITAWAPARLDRLFVDYTG
ncbi:MAG: efflux RND transporter periplasmic adaptor subunit, partial [bacterium]|nr:efflux RND transporter periplasmic adaptor subunit [bacterium]